MPTLAREIVAATTIARSQTTEPTITLYPTNAPVITDILTPINTPKPTPTATPEPTGNSITPLEPTATDGSDVTPIPPIPREVVPVVLGDVIEGEMTEDLAQHDYLYTAAAGETLVVAVVPETDDQDLTLAIYVADDLEEALVDIDDGFSGEGETLSYTFATSGDYIIRVAEFGFPDAGLFTLFIGEDAAAGALVGVLAATDLVIGTTKGELPSGESEQSFTFVANGGEILTFLLTPGNSDMDVVIEIYNLNDLDSTVAEIDSGFSGDEETLTYTFTTPGTYVITVSEFYGGGGPYTLLVTQ